MAAIPVGATITALLWVKAITFRKNVVFPVPAFPVKKICREVKFINFAAICAGCELSDSLYILYPGSPAGQYTFFEVNGSLFIFSAL